MLTLVFGKIMCQGNRINGKNTYGIKKQQMHFLWLNILGMKPRENKKSTKNFVFKLTTL